MPSYLWPAEVTIKPQVLILGSLCLGPPEATLLVVFLLEMRNGTRSTLRKEKGHYPTSWLVLSSSHLPEIHSFLIIAIIHFPRSGSSVWGTAEIDPALWKGRQLPRTHLAEQGHLERSDVKLWSKGWLGPACGVGPESQYSENFALFLPLVGRVLIFLIDSRCIWHGCLAPKPVCPDNCGRSRDTQPSIKSDRASSYSSCIIYEMNHFHSKSKSKLVLDLTDASHFILLIFSFHMLARFLSSSLILLRWNWETQSRVICLKRNHYAWLLGLEWFNKHVSSLLPTLVSEGGNEWVAQGGDWHM